MIGLGIEDSLKRASLGISEASVAFLKLNESAQCAVIACAKLRRAFPPVKPETMRQREKWCEKRFFRLDRAEKRKNRMLANWLFKTGVIV